MTGKFEEIEESPELFLKNFSGIQRYLTEILETRREIKQEKEKLSSLFSIEVERPGIYLRRAKRTQKSRPFSRPFSHCTISYMVGLCI